MSLGYLLHFGFREMQHRRQPLHWRCYKTSAEIEVAGRVCSSQCPIESPIGYIYSF